MQKQKAHHFFEGTVEFVSFDENEWWLSSDDAIFDCVLQDGQIMGLRKHALTLLFDDATPSIPVDATPLLLDFGVKIDIFDVIDQVKATLTPDEQVDLIFQLLEDIDVSRLFEEERTKMIEELSDGE